MSPGIDFGLDFLGVSQTPKLERSGVRQNIWEIAIFLKYNTGFIGLVILFFIPQDNTYIFLIRLPPKFRIRRKGHFRIQTWVTETM